MIGVGVGGAKQSPRAGSTPPVPPPDPPDPMSWTTETLPIPFVEGGNAIASKPSTSIFVIVDYASSAVSTDNGNTWTGYADNMPPYEFVSIAYGAGLFVALAEEGQIATSPDGVTWTERTSAVAGFLSVLEFNGTHFVAVGPDGSMRSTDGISWTAGGAPVADGYQPECLAWNGSIWIAAGARCFTSPNGLTWTQRTSPPTPLNGIAFGYGKFCGVSFTGGVYTTTDGITWTSQTPAVPTSKFAIVYKAGVFVTIGEGHALGGNSEASTDAVTWVLSTGAPDREWSALAGSDAGQFVAIGTDIEGGADACMRSAL